MPNHSMVRKKGNNNPVDLVEDPAGYCGINPVYYSLNFLLAVAEGGLEVGPQIDTGIL